MGVVPFCVVHLTRLEFDAYPPAILTPEHPLQRVLYDNALFGDSPLEPTQTAYVVWGLTPGALDRSKVNVLFNASYVGEPMLSEAFQMNWDSQRHIMRACELLRAADAVRVAPDLSTGAIEPMVHCWVDAFGEWRRGRGESFPVEDAAESEHALLEWLTTADGAGWTRDIGFRRDASYGTHRLEWVCVRADTKIKVSLYSQSQLAGFHAAWETIKAAVNLDAPPSAAHAFQVLGLQNGNLQLSVDNAWIQLAMHSVYRLMSIGGIAVGLGVAFAVLLVVTHSFTVALIAVASVVQVVMGVFASLSLLGWALGLVESLCLILVSGLSVDYALHVACAYAQSSEISRVCRTEAALSRSCAPLLAGTMTTCISAIALSTCTFQIMSKIGIFMAFTSLWSWATASTLLPALLATVGPRGVTSQGDRV
jgi:hypothetical protein